MELPADVLEVIVGCICPHENERKALRLVGKAFRKKVCEKVRTLRYRAGVSVIRDLDAYSNLRWLDLRGCNRKLAGEVLHSLNSPMTQCPRLERVSLSGFTSAMLLQLTAEKRPFLRELGLHGVGSGVGGASALQHLGLLSHLSRLDTDRMSLEDGHMMELSALGQLRAIHCSRTMLDDAVVSVLAPKWCQLEALSLSYTEVGDAGVRSLTPLTGLRELYLCYTRVTCDGLRALTPLSRLGAVSLRGTLLTDEGLAALKGMALLRWLDVSETDVGDVGIQVISGLAALESLDVSDTLVEDAGLLHLSRLTRLRELHLFFTDVHDEGMSHLALLGQLEVLNLEATRVTNKGLGSLFALTRLTRLNLLETLVDCEGLQGLLPRPNSSGLCCAIGDKADCDENRERPTRCIIHLTRVDES